MRVIIREAAYFHLDRIYAWIARDNPRAAQSVIDRILDSTELLGRNPYVGHVGRAPDTYEWAVRGTPYIVVYTVDPDENLLVVIAVFHGVARMERSEIRDGWRDAGQRARASASAYTPVNPCSGMTRWTCGAPSSAISAAAACGDAAPAATPAVKVVRLFNSGGSARPHRRPAPVCARRAAAPRAPPRRSRRTPRPARRSRAWPWPSSRPRCRTSRRAT